MQGPVIIYFYFQFPTGRVNSPDRYPSHRYCGTLRCPRTGDLVSQEAHASPSLCAFHSIPKLASTAAIPVSSIKHPKSFDFPNLSLMNPLIFHSSRPCQTHGPHVPRATESLHSFIETQLEGRRGVGFQYPAPCNAFSSESGVFLGSEQRLLLLSFYGTTATL